MHERILVVLGAPNSPDGQLSEIAKNRLELCFETFIENDLILCTGGWGEHFNTATRPHAHYAQEYLLKKGIPKSCFLEMALSSNTVDDAVKVKTIVSKHHHPQLMVITSDFHLERVQLIFKEILKENQLEFKGAKNSLSKSQLITTVEHEAKAIKNIREKGLFY